MTHTRSPSAGGLRDLRPFAAACAALCLGFAAAGCHGEDSLFSAGSGGSATGTGAGGAGAAAGAGGGTPTGGGGGAAPLHDPAQDGPFGYAELDTTFAVQATGHDVGIHCAYPTAGPSAGPYPVVLFGHGFQLPPSQYFGYVRRLASFGYVALTVDFQAGLLSSNHVANARELLAGIDWAAQAPELAGLADTNHVGASGHSLGGKVALLAATLDGRVVASITLDPVDSSMNCSAQNCPDVSALMPIPIPTGFVGETLDASGGFQPCAPSADNFYTFYANTTAPSLLVDVHGANHMSFLDDVSSCGFTCGFCQQPTLDNATVNGLGRAFVVAFYERYLRGDARYDTYLTGAEAAGRYVEPGIATIESR